MDEPEGPPRRRRHRPITGLSGLLLFACMFLPAVKGCHSPVYPVEMPMFLPPYLYGLVFAIFATAVSVRALRNCMVALRVITYLTLLVSIVMVVGLPPVGIVQLVVMSIVLAAMGTSGYEERRAAITTIVIGAICVVWFMVWATTPDALIGVYLSLVGSSGLVLGGLVWVADTARKVEPIELPRAVARLRE